MAKVFAKRMTGRLRGDFVAFPIGMRFNRLWKIHKWLPLIRAMGRMGLTDGDDAPVDVAGNYRE